MPNMTLDINNLSVPARTVPELIALARRLVVAWNARPLVSVQSRLEDVRAGALGLQRHFLAMEATPAVPAERRAADIASDRLWGTVRARVQSWRLLDGLVEDDDVQALIRAARAIDELLFSEGLGWVVGAGDVQWSIADTKLLGLRETMEPALVEAVVGAPFLSALEAAHERYGRVFGITTLPVNVSSDNRTLADVMRDTRSLIQDYMRGVLGTVVSRQPETLEVASALLAPITAARLVPPKPTKPTAQATGAVSSEDPAPSAPIPPLAGS